MTDLAPLWYEVPAPLSVARCESCNMQAGVFLEVVEAFAWCAAHSYEVHRNEYLPRPEHLRHLQGELPPKPKGHALPRLCPEWDCYGVVRAHGLCDKHRPRKAAA